MADHYFPNENLIETQFKVQLCDIIIEIPKLSNLVSNIINSYNLCLINYSITMADLLKKKKIPCLWWQSKLDFKSTWDWRLSLHLFLLRACRIKKMLDYRSHISDLHYPIWLILFFLKPRLVTRRTVRASM